ncbi:DUF3103 family protein [Streptomyces sp. NBC_01481]|uniref:DUF3103 family protein n=1 Tax=Streptomyces sp. NBC_01481 TaxID=2975869 RepID=UPI00224ED095|nr:DUF3103 family protein [Streptomyces sp. NBC_01481]MCX4587145.1 DUF3103 domain-containing protein [Streptomyces sp. NBC_01481]
MSTRRTHRALAGLACATLALVALPVTTAQASAASSVAAPSPSTSLSTAEKIQDALARKTAASLGDAPWSAQLRTASLRSTTVDLLELSRRAGAPAGRRMESAVAEANKDLAAAKGLGAGTGSLLRIRLADPSMRAGLTKGVKPLVAAAAQDDDRASVTAYDGAGRRHRLDANRTPDRPVYLIDIDTSKALAAGLDILDRELAKAGLAVPALQKPIAQGTSGAAASGVWTTKITSIGVADDQEPWFKGGAETYAIVTGWGQDGVPRVDTVQMPYLDDDGKTYYPNQVLVKWFNYKYNLADVVLMEDDGDTNYKALAQAIATALLTLTDQGVYAPLVDAVLAAIPDSWYTDDPDYVDSWYSLARQDQGRRNGASGNGWMTVEPYFVEQF